MFSDAEKFSFSRHKDMIIFLLKEKNFGIRKENLWQGKKCFVPLNQGFF